MYSLSPRAQSGLALGIPRSIAGRASSRRGPPPNIVQQRLSTSGLGGGRGSGGSVSVVGGGATTVTSVTAVSSFPLGRLGVRTSAAPTPRASANAPATMRRTRRGMKGGTAGRLPVCLPRRLGQPRPYNRFRGGEERISASFRPDHLR